MNQRVTKRKLKVYKIYKHGKRRDSRADQKGRFAKRVSGERPFPRGVSFRRAYFVFSFLLLYSALWRGLERGGEAAALVYSSPRHSAKTILGQVINEKT